VSYGCKGVQRYGSVRLVGVFDRRAIVWVYGNGDGVGVRMNYCRFVVIPMLAMAPPDMHVLIGRHEKSLQQGEQRSYRSKTSDHGAIIQSYVRSYL
jgi:hypothetical protein